MNSQPFDLDAELAQLRAAGPARVKVTPSEVPVPQPDHNGEFSCPADGAKFMAALGIPQTPLKGKNPSVGGTDWHLRASTDFAQIDEWARIHPGCNFGGVAFAEIGKHFVLEADSPEVRKRHQADTSTDFPKTLTIQSREGRGHRWYLQTAESIALGNISQDNRFGDFSLRMQHEQAVSPGSIHPDTGKQYRVVVNASPVVVLPADIAWLRTQKKFRTKVDRSLTGEKIPYKQHDVTLFKIACSLRHDGLEEQGMTACLIEVCEKRCEGYGDDYREMCAAKAASACKYPPGTDKAVIFKNSAYGVSPAKLPAGAESDEPDDRKEEIQQAEPVVRTGTDVTRTRIKWHWKDRIALGKITLFAGNPDNGKSVVSMWIAAATTTGRDFPDAPNLTPASDVLMMLGEDDIEDTAANRLVAAGADMSKIHFLEAVRLPDGQEREVALDKFLNQVKQCIDRWPSTRLIIIDPISNYLGEVSMMAEQEVRTDVLIPLKKLAAKYNVAVVIVMHLNKKGELDAIARVGGAMAFVGVARSSWLFVRDARDKNEDGTLGPKKNSFTMLGIKNNLIQAEKDGLTFKTVAKEIEVPDEGSEYVPVVEWTGTAVDSDPDDALDRRRQAERERPKHRTTQVDHAKQFLLDALQDGPKASAMLTAKAEAKGISYSSLYRAAKQELNVKMSGGDAGKQSVWELIPIVATSETVEPRQSELIAVDTNEAEKLKS